MICELYINGILCDLPDDEVVTLLYQSPIFSGLDIIQSNRSYNIALPPTPTNIGAVRFAERPDADSDVPYIRNTAALYQDGVPLFTQGFAVVTDISDTINVTLTWGNADNFQPLFDSNLRDLGPQLEAAGAGHIAWNADTKILEANTANKYPGVAFWGIDFGMGLNDPKYLHPSVQVETLLSAIEQYNGITIDGKERLAYSKNLGPIVPLVSRNAGEEGAKLEATRSGSGFFRNKITPYGFSKDKHGLYVGTTGELYFRLPGGTHILNIVGNSDTIDGDFRVPAAQWPNEDTLTLSIYLDTKLQGEYSNYTKESGYFIFAPIHLELEGAGDIHIYTNLTSNIISTSAGYLVTYNTEWESIFPTTLYVAPNLPDMSQGDFLLALMTMNGLFAYADKDSPNTIRLISIDDIFARIDKGEILDWSYRVILNDVRRVDMPDASVFSIDDLAQSNILDYDNDDDVHMDTHGTITVRNENIEKETELATLLFSASENSTANGVGCARVPIYEGDGKGGARHSEVSPRILSGRGTIISGVARCMGQFDPWMKFGGEEGIVKTRYASYQKVVDRLRMITVRAALTPLDLYNLDYTKPVYIAQFGQIFAVYSVETGEDGICDCRLLKLKVDGIVPEKCNPSISFSKEFPLDETLQAVTLTNDGDVDLQILTLPEFMGGASLPYDLLQGRALALNVYANNANRLRTGTIGVRYMDAGGRFIDYNAVVSQKGNVRMVIIDASSDPSLKGKSILTDFALFSAVIHNTEMINTQVDSDGIINLTFEQVAGYLNIPSLDDYEGDILEVSLPDVGISGSASVTVPGDIHIVLK